ncbi:MAG TPA: hypothetical protein EYP14_17435, partial [Planctomycetaceae bacterium]|nr:hypothetical protein [Planctomycetaceae bacterium]
MKVPEGVRHGELAFSLAPELDGDLASEWSADLAAGSPSAPATAGEATAEVIGIEMEPPGVYLMQSTPDADVFTVIHRALDRAEEPLTANKLRERLTGPFRLSKKGL